MTDKTLPITGGCLCGAVRYEASEPPLEAGLCHCSVCQKTTGSAFEAIARVPRTSFRFTKGAPKRYNSSSIMEKSFCPDCGSSLLDRYLVWKSDRTSPDMLWVHIGTLDHPEAVSIDFHYGVETQLPWLHLSHGDRPVSL